MVGIGSAFDLKWRPTATGFPMRNLKEAVAAYFCGSTGGTHPFAGYAFLRSTSVATLIAFTGLTLQSVVAAAQTLKSKERPAARHTLADAEDIVKQVAPHAWGKPKGEG